MRIKKTLYFLAGLFFITAYTHAIIPERAGWWKFDDESNLTRVQAGYGNDLTLVGSQTVSPGPEEGNGAVLIGSGSYYKMKHGISANGGGTLVNEYTLQFDFKVPTIDSWHSFFQTSVNNNSDGDLFINTGGNIGVAAVGYTGFTVVPNEWYRLVISVKNGTSFTYYLDGSPLHNGNIQVVDGRFALDSLLLIFADEDGEDGAIHCSELSIWNQTLNAEQVAELGGFGHYTGPAIMTRIPYLQAAGKNTMTICWHDTSALGTKVEYGDDLSLVSSTLGSSELIGQPYRWHTVKLTGLEPNKKYYYRVASGNGISEVHSFKTHPDESYTGKLRFVLLSDTHASDTTMAGKVLRAARAKIAELYGPDIENHVNGIFHSGDVVVSGNSVGQYTVQYFQPMSALSPYLPTMVVAGNHEGENPIFYNYLKLDEQSVFPLNPALREKVWQVQVGNSLFIGMNTNITEQYGNAQSAWLNTKLAEVENDPGIDFVFLFFHHPPFSELWFVVNTFDGGSNYVRDMLFPIIKKYSKVQQVHTGHTHGFERGTILSPTKDSDFRTVCGGGGGGPLDTWGAFENYDYHDIHIALDHYFFQILEIDIANNYWVENMYSLGDLRKPRDSEMLDSWYRKIDQPGPSTPVAENIQIDDQLVTFFSSEFSGVDSLMSVHLQVLDDSGNSAVVFDTLMHWTNIYGVDSKFIPIDKNRTSNLYQTSIKSSRLAWNKSYSFRVRYRDHNLKWSEWSNSFPFSTVGIKSVEVPSSHFILNQNFPNPFRQNTVITYSIPASSEVNFRVYDTKWRLIANYAEGIKAKGTHQIDYNPENLDNGVYYYTLVTDQNSSTRKMIKIL